MNRQACILKDLTMRKIAPALLCCFLAVPALAQTVKRLDPGLDAVIAPGTKIEKVATGFLFVEGPMWKDGKLWFSDVKGDKVRTSFNGSLAEQFWTAEG